MFMTLLEFQTRYPQFATTDPLLAQMWLDESAAELGDLWDCVDPAIKKKAHGLLTAHTATFLPVVSGGAQSGLVTSQKVGDLAESYAQNATANTEDGFNSTAFGIEFVRLRNLLLPSGLWV